jgi:hypothetical protein
VVAAIVVDERGADCVLRTRWAVKFIKSGSMIVILIAFIHSFCVFFAWFVFVSQCL